jgi:hypothetical protein
MNKKILFALFVLILFSSAVFADLTPQQVQRTKERAGLVKESHNYRGEAAKQTAYTAGLYVSSVIGGPIVAAANAPAMAKSLEKTKASQEQAEGLSIRADAYRQRLLNRPIAYSFYDYLDAYDDYSGLNVYGALYLGEEKLAKRREEAADLFCDKTLILGGKACWKSRMCDSYYYSHEPPVGQNILVVQPMVGGYEPAVSIQGEKSLPIVYKEAGKSKTKFIYKITYFISNPMDRNLNYHIQLRGADASFESPAMVVSRSVGTQIYRVDRSNINPLFTESNNNYHTVCLTFSPRLPTMRGGSASELCAPIIQYGGAATKPYEILDENLAQGTAGETPETQSVDNPLDGA